MTDDALLQRARAAADEVLSHPDHATGLDHTTLRVTEVAALTGIVRVTGVLGAAEPVDTWQQPNVAVRLRLPDPGGGAPVSRIYTVRRFWSVDGAAHIELDVVRHPHPSPGMRWADVVRAGDEVPLTGPRPHLVPTVEGCDRSIWLADSTALPAVHSLIEHWRSALPVQVIVASDLDASIAELPACDGIEIHRVNTSPGELLEVIRTLGIDARTSVWAAGERTEMRAVRRWAIDTIGLPDEQVRAFGYWHQRATSTELDAHRLIYFKDRLDRGLGMAGVDDLDIPD